MKLKFLTATIMSLSLSSMALAADAFTIKDIRIEGLQRTEPETVFTYLPVQVGDSFTDPKGQEIIKALYATGFFDDVRVESRDGLLTLSVIERPIISTISVEGGKSISNDIIKKTLGGAGLNQAHPFDQSVMNQAIVALQQEYVNRGKYAATVVPTVTKLDRNRVAINLVVTEGETSKIKEINFVGNEFYSDRKLHKQISATTGGWFTWFSKTDQYAKQKMSSDIEGLTDFYKNSGFLDFSVDSTQVELSADKSQIYLTINMTEGQRYTFGDFTLSGDTKEVPMAELEKLISAKKGKHFDQSVVKGDIEKIQDRLGKDGYAMANVYVLPKPNKDTGVVDFELSIETGRKVYVNRINISGNNKTRDEVVRRELRQMEGSVFDTSKIQRSKERIELLGYFDGVTMDPVGIPNTPDMVDVNVGVNERSTGSIDVSAGYVQDEGIVFGGGISQDNLFGSGKAASLSLSNSKANKRAVLSFTDPYFTPDGVSLGYDAFYRVYNPDRLDSSRYKTETYGVGTRLGVPVTEYDRVNFGLGVQNQTISTYKDSPDRYKDFVAEYGNIRADGTGKADVLTYTGSIGWGRNKTDSALWPTRGYMMRADLDFSLPGSDVQYYSATHQQQWFFPLTKDLTLMLNGEVGYADGYGKTKELPFFHNFYVGGIGSVRGYETSSLGPRDGDDYIGGNRKVVANAELLFPLPGIKDQRSVRLSVFADAGSVWNTKAKYSTETDSSLSSELRYSAGVALTWLSPLGPMKFSYAYPFKDKKGDDLQRFQFQLGRAF
ncbi:MAG: outer membrane protein assembly factor BamA [Neisseriaceae bacterium]|nr:outer membrane protein assembly factor BamA [Neisseriaceae bacterium]